MVAKEDIYDIVIVGAGVSGTALLYVLSHYTNVEKILLIEKNKDVALVNSDKKSNSQTLHFGDIETNYSLEKAKAVNRAASMVENYLLRYDRDCAIYSQYHKMVLAVGEEQVNTLKERIEIFKAVFPELRLIGRQEIEEIEPNVLIGRETQEEIAALFTPKGYAVDFHALSKSFLDRSVAQNATKKIDVLMEKKVSKIAKEDNLFCLQMGEKSVFARAVAVEAGAHSLLFAKSLGYGQHYALLCVAGSFYFAPEVLRGKVYAVQLKKLPFAAIHGDPEVHNCAKTRFGPTAKVIPLLERHNYATLGEYFQTAGLRFSAFLSFAKILSDPFFLSYIVKNFIYDLPWIGKQLFIQEVKKIVPSIQLKDLGFAKGYGGIRPQIVNLKTQKLEMGEAKIIGENILFNITPSPGASTCLQNAFEDTETLISYLGEDYQFNKQQFWEDLGILSLT
ncbi:FAD-dependent oxidoreductase [Lusitaniella coriacea]|uniref:FAD-dependent oxidoreductase n=1 Tax=Lusitaniella coriacea TaxID=1983105 RepID=UPI003CFAA0CB